MEKISKKEILEKVIFLLSESVKKAEKSLNEMNGNINDAPGAMQSHSDTTRFQLTKIVEGMEKAFLEKSEELKVLKQFAKGDVNSIKFNDVKIGSLISIKKNNLIENYFIIPAGSGLKLEDSGKNIICVTPLSPLGKILLGRKKGENFTYNIGGRSQTLEIIEIF
jgi:hypothetical protein